MRPIKKTLLLSLILFVGIGAAIAQTPDAIKKIADSKSFVFKAKTATINNTGAVTSGLMGGTTSDLSNQKIQLTTDATVTVRPDSVSSSLPYFDDSELQDNGNSTTSTVNVSVNEKPTHFSAKQFDYAVDQKKKGDVEVNIKPKQDTGISKYQFTIKPDGTTRLVINVGDNRITYDGTTSTN